MASSPELAVLVGALKRTASPRDRLGILFRAWKQVRRLSSEERSRLALHVGVDGAVELVEELAEGHGNLPAQPLVELLGGLKSASPASLGAFLGKLRDPEKRSALLREGLELAQRELAGPPKPGSEEGPAPETRPPPPSEASVAPPPPGAPEPAPPARPARPQAVAPPDPVVPVLVDPCGGVMAAASEPTQAADRDAARQSRHVPRQSASGPLADRLAAAPSIVARFRLLAQRSEPVALLPLAELHRILACFAPGWQRRRALQALLRRGAPSRVVDALELIAGLESPSDREWCLGSLLHSRTLTTEERARVVATRKRPGRAPASRAVAETTPERTGFASGTPAPFASRVPFEEARISTAAVYCSDGRLGDQVEDFLHQGLGLPRFDRVAVPGGPVCLARRAEGFEEAQGVEAQLRFLAGAHQLEHVILIAHDPCGFYVLKLGIPHDTLGREQLADLASAAALVRRLGLPRVSTYLARVTRGRLQFDLVSV